MEDAPVIQQNEYFEQHPYDGISQLRQLPTGTLTLLFTDIEGSTRLLQQLGDRYANVFRECRKLLRRAFEQGNGVEVDTQGDAFFVVFERAIDAVIAAVQAQRMLLAASWPDEAVVRVRMGMHTGEPEPTEEGYIGLDVHRAARIMSVAHGGQVLLSQATRDLVASSLFEGVSLRNLGSYRLKDIAGSSELFQLVISGLPADFPPLAASSALRPFQNIPSPSTSFIGRKQEAAAISELLRRGDVRLLTLIGTAGVGKTRLALHVAAQLNSLFTDGMCFLALDQLGDADAILPALAQTLNIQEEKERTLFEQIREALQGRSFLLILDNFEQVMSARPLVADLLAACPGLKVLVTTRGMLHMQAEHLVEVQPFPLPDLKHLPDVETLSHNASISLFVQRAQAVQPNFKLTAANAADIAGICARMDGIPLAIELAAARVRHFRPHALLTRLEQGLTILKGEAHDMPARQQTLRGAIAWSYDLLSPKEQRLFRRFAVFVGAMPEAVEGICAEEGMTEEGIAEVLESLVDKSMLQRRESEDGEVRFWQLQTLREYALERLTEAGELEAAQAAHAGYYLSWMEQLVPLLSGAEQAHWLDRLDQEYENARLALEWLLERAAVETERAEQALRLDIALLGFWEIRGYFNEGLSFLERALARRQNTPPSVQAQALHGAAFLALMQDDNARAEEFLRECQLLFRESGDRAGMANILRLQGSLAIVKSSYKLARRLLEEALAIYREQGDMQKVALTREALGQVAIAQCDYSHARALLEEDIVYYRARGEQYSMAYPLYLLARALFLSRSDRADARALAEESLVLFKTVGNKPLMAYTLCLLGQIRFMENHEDGEARSMLEESIATFKALGDRSCSAEALIALARLDTLQGEYEAARACYEEAWTLLQAIGARELGASCLEGLGETLVALGTPRRAVQLWGTAATVRAAIVAPMQPAYRASYTHAVNTAREKLGEEAFQAAWTEGRGVGLEQVEISQAS